MKRYSPKLILILTIALVIPSTALGSSPTGGEESPDLTPGLGASLGLLASLPPGGTFVDDNGHQFEGAIEAIAAENITSGCNPPINDRFCLEDDVTRGEMAVFLDRAFRYDGGADDSFVDDDGRFYEEAANRIHREGVTQGCNPPTKDRYCGENPITRGQMAALMVRALGLTDNGKRDLFQDDDGSIFEEAIDRFGAAGITSGCNPPDNDRFCPNDLVTRGQMAVFIARALGLSPIIPPPAHGAIRPPGDTVSGTITGKACANGCVVIGEATLKGDIDLEGDLAVFGGTLVARSGVNLDGNGHQITFLAGGKADFQGTKTSTWSNNGAIQNLKRDLNIRNVSRIMFMNGAGPSTLSYFAVHDSGVFKKTGFYPLHWHLNRDSTRGTIVEGVVVRNGRNHAFVPHGSNGITFRDTIAKNTITEAYWWDPTPRGGDPWVNNPRDIVYDHVLADGVRSILMVDGSEPGQHHRNSAFELLGGTGLVIRNSAALNVSGGVDCSGFDWPEGSGTPSVWKFENNYSKSSECHGIFVWQNDAENHVISGFNGDGIKHGAYSNHYTYRNMNVPYLIQTAVGNSYVDSYLGHAVMDAGTLSGDPVRFTNVEFASFTVDDGDKPKGATYVLRDTNIKTCDQVKFKSINPASRVIIDGKEC